MSQIDNARGEVGRLRAGLAPPVDSGQTGPHLLHYLRVMVRRRWTALTTLLMTVGITAFVTIRTVPLYEAGARLMIEIERPRVIVFAEDEKNERGDEFRDYQGTQRRILQSRALASRTIETLSLWQHPELGGGRLEEPSFLDARANEAREFFASLPSKFSKSPNYSRGALVQYGGPDPDRQLGFEDNPERTPAIDTFLKRLTIREVPDSRLVDVSYRSREPKLAAAIVNALTEAYIEQNKEFKTTVANEATEWLGTQLEEHRKQLQKSQQTLQTFRENRPDAAAIDGADLVLRRLEGLNAALLNARTARIEKETISKQVEQLASDRAGLESLEPVRSNVNVQSLQKRLADLEQQDLQLAQTLGEKHPQRVTLRLEMEGTRERLTAEVDSVVERVASDFAAARDQELNLVRAVEAQRAEATATTGKRAEYDMLARAASTDQEIFQTLLQRTKETGVTTGLVATNIRVVDPASVPQRPVVPDTKKNLTLALFAGLMLSVCAVFFADYMDKSITSPEQIKSQLGLDCLGLVPLVDGYKSVGPTPLINTVVPAGLHEAVRSLRTGVLFSSRGEQVRSILVTSTAPGEGKSMVAANLALSLAQTGQRVVLVDADMRRPRLHTMFRAAQSPGLSELVAGQATPKTAIVRTSVPGLWLMPAGSIPSNPSEMLSSNRFERFVSGLSEVFGWVVIDSPPVMAVTDASLLAHITTGVLFVVGAEQTTVPVARHALEQLDAAQARFLGAVLNKVNLKRNAFYYGDYYRREYGDYYSARADVSPVSSPPSHAGSPGPAVPGS